MAMEAKAVPTACMCVTGHLQQPIAHVLACHTNAFCPDWAAVMACGRLALWPGNPLVSLSALPCQAHEPEVPSVGLRMQLQCTLIDSSWLARVQIGALLGPNCTPCLHAQLSQC